MYLECICKFIESIYNRFVINFDTHLFLTLIIVQMSDNLLARSFRSKYELFYNVNENIEYSIFKITHICVLYVCQMYSEIY